MNKNSRRSNQFNFPALLFVFAIVFVSVLYGMVAMHNKWFPYNVIKNSLQLPQLLFPGVNEFFWYLNPATASSEISIQMSAEMQPGLTKIVDVEADRSLAVKVLDSAGKSYQHWTINWPDVWPQRPDYLANASDVPMARPGTHIHGAEILDNGDLVFNFEHLSLVRMDPCGNVVWKVPFRTHHSVFVDDGGNLWVPGQINHLEPLPQYPFMKPTFIEPFVLKVSPEGEILLQKSVFELLEDNHLQSLLYATSVGNFKPIVTDDTLHMNDVEVFSSTMAAGFFQPGDIMISLRNVNTVFVFDPDWHLKYKWSGDFVRQHDPDFIDGNTITLLDNNNVGEREQHASSRILSRNVLTNTTTVLYQGTEESPFFTNIMGKQQRLENGNLLVSESAFGRAFELSPNNSIVWEFNNLIEPGWSAIIEEAERLPPAFDAEFFAQARARCEANTRQANPDHTPAPITD